MRKYPERSGRAGRNIKIQIYAIHAKRQNGMIKVFFDVSISLDGFIAGENRGPRNPLGDGGVDLHKWLFRQKSFREAQKIGETGETGRENDMVLENLARTGASIMGKNMFNEGEKNWPENLFKTPVYVLTHEHRKPWVQRGSTTFYYLNEGIETILQNAKVAADGRDVRISGGANIIQQFLNAGLVDEFTLHIAPMLIGSGIRLFENIDKSKVRVEILEAIHSPLVTHIKYRIRKE